MRLIIDEKTDRFICSDDELAGLRECLAELRDANRVVAYTNHPEPMQDAAGPESRSRL
jgi:hypothetical protein